MQLKHGLTFLITRLQKGIPYLFEKALPLILSLCNLLILKKGLAISDLGEYLFIVSISLFIQAFGSLGLKEFLNKIFVQGDYSVRKIALIQALLSSVLAVIYLYIFSYNIVVFCSVIFIYGFSQYNTFKIRNIYYKKPEYNIKNELLPGFLFLLIRYILYSSDLISLNIMLNVLAVEFGLKFVLFYRNDKGKGVIKWNLLTLELRQIFILYLSLILAAIASRIDSIVFKLFFNSKELGIYLFSKKIFDVLLMLAVVYISIQTANIFDGKYRPIRFLKNQFLGASFITLITIVLVYLFYEIDPNISQSLLILMISYPFAAVGLMLNQVLILLKHARLIILKQIVGLSLLLLLTLIVEHIEYTQTVYLITAIFIIMNVIPFTSKNLIKTLYDKEVFVPFNR